VIASPSYPSVHSGLLRHTLELLVDQTRIPHVPVGLAQLTRHSISVGMLRLKLLGLLGLLGLLLLGDGFTHPRVHTTILTVRARLVPTRRSLTSHSLTPRRLHHRPQHPQLLPQGPDLEENCLHLHGMEVGRGVHLGGS